jgi:hypothetical protein
MPAPKIERRTILKGLLGGAAVSIALPVLDMFLDDGGRALAGGTALPKRFGLFFWGNGVLPDRWQPTGEGAAWELSEQLAPLAPVKDVISVVTGMRVQTGNHIAHESGASGFLAGSRLLINGDAHTFQLPSIDQVIADEIGGATRYRSLEVGVQPGAKGYSHTGPNSMNPPESSPYEVFQRLFGPGFTAPGDEPVIDPKLGLRRSVLDAVMDDTNSLIARVGAADRARLEQHFEGIRDLELRLARLEEDPPNLASCEKPAEPMIEYPPIDGRPQMSAVSRAMSDLMTMALACDQTRVFSMWFSDSVSNVLYPGAGSGHHQLTHDEPGDQPQVNDIVLQIIGELGYLVDRLRSIPEGDGTLLDSCAILGTTDCSYGRQHALEEYPIIIAGTAQGALTTGIHYRSIASENASKVPLSLVRAMGIPAASFGAEDGLVTDGLGAIES